MAQTFVVALIFIVGKCAKYNRTDGMRDKQIQVEAHTYTNQVPKEPEAALHYIFTSYN